MAGVTVTVYRQTAQAAWAAVASMPGDGTGMVRFEDANVQPGARYGYRLGVRDDLLPNSDTNAVSIPPS